MPAASSTIVDVVHGVVYPRQQRLCQEMHSVGMIMLMCVVYSIQQQGCCALLQTG
jgi:hypothetical protein